MTMANEPGASIKGVPGTVHLVDLDHTMHAQHAGNGDIILDPSPSSDPDDPLNWTPRRKLMATICSNLYAYLPNTSVPC